MQPFEKNGFRFDHANVLQAAIITSKDQVITRAHCFQVDGTFITSRPFVSVEITGHSGTTYTFLLEVREQIPTSAEELSQSLESLFEAFQAGVKAIYDDVRSVRQLSLCCSLSQL